MKARVKATGEIVEVYRYGKPYYIEYIGEKPGRTFYPEEKIPRSDLREQPDGSGTCNKEVRWKEL